MNKQKTVEEIVLGDLDICISEDRRFIARAIVTKRNLESGKENSYRSAANAASKRASLDLSKILSAYRKGPYRGA